MEQKEFVGSSYRYARDYYVRERIQMVMDLISAEYGEVSLILGGCVYPATVLRLGQSIAEVETEVELLQAIGVGLHSQPLPLNIMIRMQGAWHDGSTGGAQLYSIESFRRTSVNRLALLLRRQRRADR